MTDSGVPNAPSLRRVLAVAERWFAANRDAINAINVYPVPDGDTGTNMLLTIRAGLAALDAASEDADSRTLADRLARGTLLGARGNSGVILSQMVRGAAEVLGGLEMVDARAACLALQRASDVAYAAVTEPVEGTMLTVLREAAAAAAAACPPGLIDVLCAAQGAAEAALARTPAQLPRLREAGVVDAGGMGIAILLAGLRMALSGEDLPASSVAPAEGAELSAMAHTGYGYCTEFIVQGSALDASAMNARLHELGGESVLVVGDASTLHVHAHLADPGPAISAGAALGSLSGVKIEDMQAQHDVWAEAVSAAGAPSVPGLGLVAVARGAGLATAFRGFGAAVVSSADGARPSAGELLAAANRTGRERVFLLPNDRDVLMAAEQAATESDGRIHVLPSVSIAAGLSAAMAFNADDTADRAETAMRAALAGVRCIEVTRAARTTSIDGVAVERGQAIALLDGHLVACEAALDDALLRGIAAALARGPAEIVTVYLGEDVPADAGPVQSLVASAYPDLNVEVIEGGQPHYPYIAGVE